MATVSTRIASAPVTDVKNILFATDFSGPSMKAFSYVTSLAKRFGASVFACHAITPSSMVTAAPQAAPYLYEAEYNTAEKELANIVNSTDLQGIQAKALLSAGMLGDVVVDQIKENHIDLVVAGTHGRTGIRRFLLGSGVEDICRAATCPVLTIGPDFPATAPEFTRILLPTDLSAESARVLPIVIRMAHEYGAAVTVLHVMPEELAGNPDAPKLSQPILSRMTDMFETQLGSLKLGSLKTEFLLETGGTAEAILKVAHERKADLIAMGIRSAFYSGFSLGNNVAYKVMAGAECPVVTCKESA
jgi:nucleotide-binding universal stress UspA family protein